MFLLTSERLSCNLSWANCLSCTAWQLAACSGLPQDTHFKTHFTCCSDYFFVTEEKSFGIVKGEREASWICACDLSVFGWFSNIASYACPSRLSWRAVCVFAHNGSHTVRLPAEPPRPGAGPTSRLHPVSPGASRTLGPRLLPWPGLFVVLLLYLLTLALYHLQLPGWRQPVSWAAPPPPSPRPPALPAASPPTSAPYILAYPADAVTWQQYSPQSLPPTLPLIPRQWAHAFRPGPPRWAQYVRQHPQSRQWQHPYRGLLCACRLWQADFVTCWGREEKRQEEKWQFR